jgi:hypothetical protein
MLRAVRRDFVDTICFDCLTRTCSTLLSRRGLLVALGLVTAGTPDLAAAKKPRKKKLKKNEFGCVNVGGKCRGKDRLCCSGICQGKKPKKGEKDTSRCVDHDTGGCLPGTYHCDDLVPCTTSAGNFGGCATTTGHAGYCKDGFPGFEQPCRRDADCQEALGESAACVYCPSSGTATCRGIDTS